MKISEVVIDKSDLFLQKQSARLQKKLDAIAPNISVDMEKQAKLEKWMNMKIDLIDHQLVTAEFDKRAQMLLRPVTRNFIEVSPIEVLQWAIEDQGESMFTDDQYLASLKVAKSYTPQILAMLDKQIQAMKDLAAQADNHEWPAPWKRYVPRYSTTLSRLEGQRKFFSKFQSTLQPQ